MSGQHCENYDVKRETVHCYSRNVDRCCWNLSALFKICFRFVLLYNKSLNDWSLGEQWIFFPSNLNVSLDFVLGNIEILGKQNSLLPSGPVIKCLLYTVHVYFAGKGETKVQMFQFPSLKKQWLPLKKQWNITEFLLIGDKSFKHARTTDIFLHQLQLFLILLESIIDK